MKRSALGRGLAALIPEAPAGRPSAVGEVAIGAIRPNPLQPRRTFSPEGLTELAASIARHGLLQPVVVARTGERDYVLIAGERRWRAAQQAGLERIPAVVRESADDSDRLALALIENLQREDLTPIEAARAFHHLRTEAGLSQEEIASRVGKDRSTVANALRLLQLPLEVQAMVDAGRLSGGHARALAGPGVGGRAAELAMRSIAAGWSVRDLERHLRATTPRRRRVRTDAETVAAAERLSRAIGATVEIVRRRRGGEIRIRFGTEDELIRLFKQLAQEKR
jgi:ParB family transcriptional regulator, chromosome partitioning protein